MTFTKKVHKPNFDFMLSLNEKNQLKASKDSEMQKMWTFTN